MTNADEDALRGRRPRVAVWIDKSRHAAQCRFRAKKGPSHAGSLRKRPRSDHVPFEPVATIGPRATALPKQTLTIGLLSSFKQVDARTCMRHT